MLVITRFRTEPDAIPATELRESLERAREVLAECRGFREGWVGRCVDEPGLWTLTTVWENVGAYRRALSSYEVKLHVVPTLYAALDEPSAYEVVEPGAELNDQRSRSLG